MEVTGTIPDVCSRICVARPRSANSKKTEARCWYFGLMEKGGEERRKFPEECSKRRKLKRIQAQSIHLSWWCRLAPYYNQVDSALILSLCDQFKTEHSEYI